MTATTGTTGTTDDARRALTAALPAVEQWIAYRAWKLRVPGVQYAIWFDGAVRLSGAVGSADLESQTPLTTRHLFRIASHSKMFTAVAVLQLAEQGRLRLDDRLGDHVPELAEAPSGVGSVRVRELLEHAGGVLRDGLDGDYWQHGRPFPDEAELLAMLADDGVKSDPNARFDYSNMGYSLLGLVVARVGGGSYDDYVQREIVDRLDLADTAPDHVATRAGDYATGYTGFHTALERRPISHVATRAMAAATGFTSTAEDAVRFLAAQLPGDETLLSDASKRLQQRALWAPMTDPDSTARYGLGMSMERMGDRTVIGHSGGYPGHITRTMLDPNDGIAISVLTNAIDGPAAELATGVLTLLDKALTRDRKLTLGRGTASAAPLPDDTSRFEGRFANLWGVIDVVRLGDALLGLNPGQPVPLEGSDVLEVVDDDTLRIVSGDGFGSVGERIRYERDASGDVVRIRAGGGMSLWPFDQARGAFTAPWPA